MGPNYEAPDYAIFSSLQLIQSMLFLNVRDDVSHPYNTSGITIVLYKYI
jgi:hypothetical protein